MVRSRVAGLLVLMGSCGALACDRADPDNSARPAAAAPAPVAAKDAPAPTVTAASRCAEICEHVRALHCPGEPHCLSQCKEMSGVAVCHAEMLTVLSCMAGEPASHFECDDEDGAAALREGVCSAEQARFAACYDARSPAP